MHRPDPARRVAIEDSTATAASRQWLLWQLADSAFPTGGFAHSSGIEAACQHGELRGGTELAEYLRAALNQTARAALPFVSAAWEQQRTFAEVDRACDAFLSNHVANRASRLQGQAFVSTCERVFPLAGLRDFRGDLLDQGLPGHGAPVFGQVLFLLGVDAPMTARLFVFTQLRGWISAAIRLNIVGPLEGQAIQHQLGGEAEDVAAQFGRTPLEDAAQTAPLLDLWQGTQDRLYSRLFQT